MNARDIRPEVPEPQTGPAAMRRFMREHPIGAGRAVTFHGTNGETLTARHDDDGVMIRTEFSGNHLSAAEARRLAEHLTACAERAEAWMREAIR